MRRLLFLLPILVLIGCQKRQEPVPLPTQDQWRRVQENLLPDAPTPQFPVNATFDGTVRLLGWDIEPGDIEVGGTATMTFYWEVLAATDRRWTVFVHLDANERQNADHETIEGLYPSVYWQPGEILRDVVEVELDPAIGPGTVEVFIGLFRDNERMPIDAPGQATLEDSPDPVPRLHIGSFSTAWDPPSYTIRAATGPINVDGRGTDRAWARAQRTDVWVHPVTGEETESGEAWAKLLWDADALYVLMSARDSDIWSTITARDGDLWDEEVLEFYFDGSGDGTDYVEFQINPLGTVFDAVFPAPANRDLAAARAVDLAGLASDVYVSGSVDNRDDSDRSWTAEVRIPFAALPGLRGTPTDGDEVRMNFYRYDRPAEGAARTSAWSPVGPGTFHHPERFGTATFVGGPTLPAVEGSGQVGPGGPTPNEMRTAPGVRGRPGRLLNE